VALQGTIKDFALPDILQLIGIQRKTGILTLENEDDKVTVKFQDGQVVGADTASEGVESRLGSVLVRTGRITEAQLAEALQTQRKTLQRLGHILVQNEMITSDELVEGLNVQSTQILYRLFRWSEGTYDFQAVEKIDYDRSHFVPISADSLLMEGARMVDEWPIIERRIKSETMVLRKTKAGESVDLRVRVSTWTSSRFSIPTSTSIWTSASKATSSPRNRKNRPRTRSNCRRRSARSWRSSTASGRRERSANC